MTKSTKQARIATLSKISFAQMGFTYVVQKDGKFLTESGEWDVIEKAIVVMTQAAKRLAKANGCKAVIFSEALAAELAALRNA